MKRVLSILLVLCMLCTVLPMAAFAEDSAKPFAREGIIYYYSQHSKDMESYSYSYDEAWFTAPSTEYNHDLARMSIRMAMSSCDMNDYTDGDRSYSIRHIYDDLGFEYTDTTPTDTAESDDTVWYPLSADNTVGYSIAKKQMVDANGKEFTLVALMPRSMLYIREWAGNFDIGSGTEHEGFGIAADFIRDAAMKYFEEQNIQGDIKLWIAGYSRGAAVANVLGQRMDEIVAKGEIRGLTTDNVYVYTFEAPQTVMPSDARYTDRVYNNIFNVLGPADVVTKVAPARWGFVRYGIDCSLPTPETALDFAPYQQALTDSYAALVKAEGLSDKESREVAEENTGYGTTLLYGGQATVLNETVNELADWLGAYQDGTKATAHYVRYYQDNMMSVGRAVGEKQGVLAIVENVLKATPTFVPTHLLTLVEVALNIKSVGSSHYSERCLAWLDAIDGFEDFHDCRTRHVGFFGSGDMEIYSGDKLVARVNNGIVMPVKGSTLVSWVGENGKGTVSLPADEEFTVKLTADNDGYIWYSVEEYDTNSGKVGFLDGWYKVPVKAGDVLISEIPALSAGRSGLYELTLNGSAVAPSTEKGESEIVNYNIDISSEGGVVTGAGSYVGGEYIVLNAEADDSVCAFDGWYENGKLVSRENSYGFIVSRDRSLTAKFTDHVWQNVNGLEKCSECGIVKAAPFADVNRSDYFFEAVSWAYTNNVAAGTDATHFAPNAKCTRAQVIAFLWRAAGCPEPGITDSPFSDVDTDAYYGKAILWAAEKGIAAGYPDGSFRPDSTVTRAHFIAFLWRYHGCPEAGAANPFKDVKADSPYCAAIAWGAENGIISGYTHDSFKPDMYCTRAQAVSFLYRDAMR